MGNYECSLDHSVGIWGFRSRPRVGSWHSVRTQPRTVGRGNRCEWKHISLISLNPYSCVNLRHFAASPPLFHLPMLNHTPRIPQPLFHYAACFRVSGLLGVLGGHPGKGSIQGLHSPLKVFRPRPTGRRPRGRPRTRWRNYISHLAWERLGIPQEELESVAEEKEAWRALLSLLPPRSGPG